MQDLLAGESGGQYLTAILWTVGALVALLIVLFVVRLLRKGTEAFSGGGRDRRPRLALGDSIEVDKQRRLVLVRRDDVEHLILTGGPTDVVVEQGIRPDGAPVRPHLVQREPDVAAPRPTPVPVPQSAVAAPHRAPQPVAEPAPAPRPEPARPVEARAEPVRSEPAVEMAARPSTPAPSAQAATITTLEREAVARPAEVHPAYRNVTAAAPAQASAATAEPIHFPTPQPHAAQPSRVRGPEEDEIVEFPQEDAARQRRQSDVHQGTLEDEMSRLLEDISDDRR